MSSLVSLDSAPCERDAEVARFGQKGAYLRWLVQHGEHVPQGFVIPVDAAVQLRARDEQAVGDLSVALDRLAQESGTLAVRASPTVSLPGALLTVLDLTIAQGTELLERVLLAVDEVLASADKPAARDQLSARGIEVAGPWVALVVQRMVQVTHAHDFGAVACTHDPSRGEAGVFGEFASGKPVKAVVSGRSRPDALSRAGCRPGREDACLEVAAPQVFALIRDTCARLFEHSGEPLELELVIAQHALWLVQARPLVLSPRAALQVALDAVRTDRPAAQQLLRRLSSKHLEYFVEARLPDPAELQGHTVIAKGLAASPGVATGRLIFDLQEALSRAATESVVLVRRDALPEDVAAFRAARGVVTTSGGLTSHAAVIARGLRIPAAIGCSEVRIDAKARTLSRTSEIAEGGVVAREGDLVTVDGHRGLVYAGLVSSVPNVAVELRTLCAALGPRRTRPLLTIGPSPSAERAYEECALDGIWNPHINAYVRGSATTKDVLVVGDPATDSERAGQSKQAALACPPEHAAEWVLWLASEAK